MPRFLVRCSLLLCVLLSPAYGQPPEHHTLWKVQSKTNTVYLMGSIHAMKAEHYPLAPALETAFEQSRHVVTEVDVDSLGLREVIQGLVSRGVYTDGTTLSAHISPEVHAMLNRMAASIGLNPGQLEPFRPWLAAITLTSLYFQKLGFTAENGLDRYFYNKARAQQKPRRALETIRFQTDLFAAMPDELQARMLEQTLKEFYQADAFLNEIFQGWKNGNAAVLDSVLSENAADFPEIHQRLFLDRNVAWVGHIEGYLTEREPYLVIVGAGHLVGKAGVVDLLRRKGYDVEQQ